jgi:hypothetical protein
LKYFFGLRRPDSFRGTVRKIVLLFSVAASLAIALAYGNGTVAYAACDLQTTSNNGNWFAGAEQGSISNLEGVSGFLWNYHVNPVYRASAFSVMLTVSGGLNIYSQIGWNRVVNFYNMQYETPFLQHFGSSGILQTKWYHPNAPQGEKWKDTPVGAASITSTKFYEIFKIGGWWYYRFDYGEYHYVYDTSWNPNVIKVFGEVLKYQAGTPIRGDHFPGDNLNHINANNVKKNVSGTWSDTALVRFTPTGPGNSDLDNQSGDGVRVWDTRCNS